jgi:aryl-alcohol dehydrogenase-like predicted oxidoreductase
MWGVIVRSPFDEGGLTGAIDETTQFPDDDWRREYFLGDRQQELARRVRSLADDLDIAPDEVSELALRFVLSAEEVSTVIPGMRSIRNIERNAAASHLGAIPSQVLSTFRPHHWGRNWYVYD